MINVVYIFKFNDDKIEKALKRASCSIQSIINQTGPDKASIIFLNFSKKDVINDLNFPMEYHHIPFKMGGAWNRAMFVNHAVKHYVKSLYFFLSDIDLVYPPNYIQKMLDLAYKTKQQGRRDVRISPNILWLMGEYYNSDYNNLLTSNIKTEQCIGTGVGLFHTDSFIKLRGVDESFNGWGQEDKEFNARLSKINKCVEASDINVFHLFHPRGKNWKYYNKKNSEKLKYKMEIMNQMDNVIIPENMDSDWGELKDDSIQISICIPTYEMGGYGVKYLTHLINSIAMQSFKEYEIVISDHSKNNEIEQLCNSNVDLPIRYYRYQEKYGNSPANTNHAIRLVKGKYIKPMFQDDCFIDRDALSILYNLIETQSKKWIACSSEHIDINGNTSLGDVCIPRWHPEGKNNIKEYFKDPYIGSPSRVMWKNGYKLFFDENLVHYMDVDMWYRIGNILDDPIIFSDKHLVSCRKWKGSVTNIYGQLHPLNKEQEYLFRKHQ